MSRVHGLHFSSDRFSAVTGLPVRRGDVTEWSVDREGAWHVGRIAFSGGWSLNMETELFNHLLIGEAEPLLFRGSTRYWLDGLRLTPQQAVALSHLRPDAYGARHYTCAPDGTLITGNVSITREEAQAVADGDSPYDLIIPGLCARVLTTEELMRR